MNVKKITQVYLLMLQKLIFSAHQDELKAVFQLSPASTLSILHNAKSLPASWISIKLASIIIKCKAQSMVPYLFILMGIF